MFFVVNAVRIRVQVAAESPGVHIEIIKLPVLVLTATSCLSFRFEDVLGASWEHRGRVVGPSWTVMVASWGVLWPSWAVL